MIAMRGWRFSGAQNCSGHLFLHTRRYHPCTPMPQLLYLQNTMMATGIIVVVFVVTVDEE